MQKIILFSVAELVLDPDGVAAALDKACGGRQGRYRVSGLCQVEEQVYVALVERGRGQPAESHQFRAVGDTTAAGFTAALFDSWSQGCNVIGAVASGSDRLLLLARPSRAGRRA